MQKSQVLPTDENVYVQCIVAEINLMCVQRHSLQLFELIKVKKLIYLPLVNLTHWCWSLKLCKFGDSREEVTLQDSMSWLETLGLLSDPGIQSPLQPGYLAQVWEFSEDRMCTLRDIKGSRKALLVGFLPILLRILNMLCIGFTSTILYLLKPTRNWMNSSLAYPKNYARSKRL